MSLAPTYRHHGFLSLLLAIMCTSPVPSSNLSRSSCCPWYSQDNTIMYGSLNIHPLSITLGCRLGLACSRTRIWDRSRINVRPELRYHITPLQASANGHDVHRRLWRSPGWCRKYHHVEQVIEWSDRIQDGRTNQCSIHHCVAIPGMHARAYSVQRRASGSDFGQFLEGDKKMLYGDSVAFDYHRVWRSLDLFPGIICPCCLRFMLFQVAYMYPFFYFQVDSLRHGLGSSFSFYSVSRQFCIENLLD